MNDRPDQRKRPSPDALLQQAKQESRGRLKVFLGAAPGVGKTHEMLTTAQARLRDGIDVVVGVVETHGRAETASLLTGLEIVPRLEIHYRGHTLDEMDLDAILKRRPKLVLVDELAHSNPEGSRHPKRYLDVEELLDAGIDVFTTLNIQHLESLNDVVAQITRIRVRETVPDSVIDGAEEVELVDLTPEGLIRRLEEGKVYLPRQAERALKHYFLPGNLTALRELALRRTAQRVDQQMVTYMRAHAIQGPWAASERILVCVGPDPDSPALVRHARRFAERIRAPWTAIHVETAQSARLNEAARDQVAECLRLAQRLGGVAVTEPGQNIASTVIEYSRSHNFTHIVVAKPAGRRWREYLNRPLAYQIIRAAGDISVHVIAPQRRAEDSAERVPARPPAPGSRVNAYIGSFGIVAAALAVGLFLQQFLAVSNIALVFLTAILCSAVTYGLAPSLFGCVVSVLAYNFFFLPPIHTFAIADPENVVALFFFAVVAVIASNLAARVRAEAIAARLRAKTTEDLYLFSRKLAGAVTLDDLLWATAFQMASMLKMRVVLLLPNDGSVAPRAGYPPEDSMQDADIAAAKWCWDNNRPAGRGSDTLPGAKRLFMPLHTGRGAVGVVGLDSDRPGPLLTPDERRLLDALADQAALAIERVNLAHEVERAEIAVEAERLRSALLTSISHDLRTPLASILGSATSLRSYRGKLDAADEEELLATIQEESERLNRFIANLLDMTKLEAGAVKPLADLVELSDIIGSALERARKVTAGHRIGLDIAPDLPLLQLDPVLFEQALFNLLDNAAKYAPDGTTIALKARSVGDTIVCEISDEGDGIRETDVERIFDKFYRVQASDHRRAGTGLGLAICRGFIEAMGGTITAGNRPDRSGAVFRIVLPAQASEDAAQAAIRDAAA